MTFANAPISEKRAPFSRQMMGDITGLDWPHLLIKKCIFLMDISVALATFPN